MGAFGQSEELAVELQRVLDMKDGVIRELEEEVERLYELLEKHGIMGEVDD